MMKKEEFKEFEVVIKSLHFILYQSTVCKMPCIHCNAQILFIRMLICIAQLFWLLCKLLKQKYHSSKMNFNDQSIRIK